MKYVYQLFDQGHFKSVNRVSIEFGITVLQYNSLKYAIPLEWKEFFKQNAPQTFFPLAPHNLDRVSQERSLSRIIYSYLNGNISLLHSKFVKWNEDLSEDIAEGLYEFGRLHLNRYSLTNVPRLRSFEYKILQRSVVTNSTLFKWKLIPSNLCTFCKEEPETLIHLFCTCPIVVQLWMDIKDYLIERYDMLAENLVVSNSNIIKNQITKGRTDICNFVCMLAKRYIYVQRCKKLSINCNSFKQLVNDVQRTEKYIAVKNGKLSKHDRKWERKTKSKTNSHQDYAEEFLFNM